MSLNKYTYKDIWKISYPMIISGIGQSVINVMDTIFMGRLGEVEIGAAAIGGLYYFTVFMLTLGLCTGLQIIIARLEGENKRNEIGCHIDLGLKIVFVIALLFFILGRLFLPSIFTYFIHSEKILKATLSFLQYREIGYFFLFSYMVLRSFYLGTSHTVVIAAATIIMALSNLFLNIVLVFGYEGIPAMGIKGTALASTISEGIAFLFILFYTINKINLSEYGLFRFSKIKFKDLNETMKLSSPLMLQFFLSMVSWFVFFMIIEQTGERPLAISNLVRNVYMLIMVPLIAYSSVTSTIVSNLIGQGRNAEIIHSIKKLIVLSLASTLLVNIVFVLVSPNSTLSLFTENNSLIKATIPSLWIISGSSLLFSVVNILLNSVSGTGSTRTALFIEMVTLIFYLYGSYYVAIKMKLPIEQVWLTEYVYFGIIGILSFTYLVRKKYITI